MNQPPFTDLSHLLPGLGYKPEPLLVQQIRGMNKSTGVTMYYHKKEMLSGEELLSSHFQVKEVACKCCGLVRLESFFMSHLEILRSAAGFPLPINSACRCPQHNADEDGREGSFHLTDNPKYPVSGTCAVDVGWTGWSSEKKQKLIDKARDLGWSVGLANSFCHLDKRSVYMDYPRVDFKYEGFRGL